MIQETSGKYAKQNAIDLSSAASKWLTSLDKKVRPKHLPEQYPRIVNRTVELWQQPDLMRTYFEEIMLNTRGNRAGLPNEVVVELGSLKHHYNRVLSRSKSMSGKESGRKGTKTPHLRVVPSQGRWWATEITFPKSCLASAGGTQRKRMRDPVRIVLRKVST